MYLLRIPFAVSDIIILQAMALVLGVVIYFVVVNRRKLQAMMDESKKQAFLTSTGGRYVLEVEEPRPAARRKAPAVLAKPFASLRQSRQVSAEISDMLVAPNDLSDLKQSIRQQQKTLDQLLHRVHKLDADESKPAPSLISTKAWEEKETELQKTKQQLSVAQKVAGRVTEVYEEFDELQQKIADLEESAAKANALTLELDDVQQAYEQLKKEGSRRQERLQEAVDENEQLHQRLAETEDKLAEANLQRQQLYKKVQLLENMNAEMHGMNEANKKLKTELRRIAELESMLSLVSDERDLLLKKRLH